MSCGSGGTSWGGGPAEIINLNVGGTKFSTSKQTLIAIPVSIDYFISLEDVKENSRMF